MSCAKCDIRTAARWAGRVSILTCTVSAAGCAATNADILHFLQEHEHKVSAIEYRVGIPDALSISAFDIPEVDGATRQIQPDGKINFDLLGDVKVVGLTAKEVAAKLEVLLSRYYVDPKVSARVASYASKKYYMHGQTGINGPRPYTGRDTLLDAVLTSGVTFQSWTSRVTVTRPTHGDRPVRTLRVNIDEMLRKGDWSKNILLEPNDIVRVPPTPLAWIAQRIRDLIFPVSPVIQAYGTPLQFATVSDSYDIQSNRRRENRARARR